MDDSSSASHRLANRVLDLYNPKKDSDAIIDELYSTNIFFDDPLVQVRGIPNLKSQFRLVRAFASKSEATLIRGSLNKNILSLESDYSASFYPIPMLFKINLKLFSTLVLRDGKIITHTDFWDLRSCIENIPIIGTIHKIFRPLFGTISSAFVNVMGLGKSKEKLIKGEIKKIK